MRRKKEANSSISHKNEDIAFRHGDLHHDDIQWIKANCQTIAIDTETTGLNPLNNSLELIQLYCNGRIFLLKYSSKSGYENLKKILKDEAITKIFHNATFDIKFLTKNLFGLEINNLVCTKIAAKILQGIAERNSLKILLSRYLNIQISKEQQTSDWAADSYSHSQIDYAINDVLYLSPLWNALKEKLVQKNQLKLANQCFSFVPSQAKLELNGIQNIFTY